MRKKVEYYNGRKITKNVLKRIHIIDLKRIKEEINQYEMEEIRNLRELCEIHESSPEQEYIILGEDWYISYTKNSDDEIIDIKDWVAINSVENKFAQTMEMFNALKKILLEHEKYDIYSMLRHSTSYPFYEKMLNEGYIDEGYDMIDFDDYLPNLEDIKQEILTKYDSIEDYLSDENREKYLGSHMEDYIYHNVVFNMTDKFINRYKKNK